MATNTGGGGPAERNPFKDENHAADAGDQAPARNPADPLTDQDQPKDAGPLSHERKIGENTGRGRPPLMEK